ncbi:MAG: serine hydrolase, partial [Actinomycetota bacterium]|nr:serine hydrolase [Actinomycetota bacterium]
MASLWRRRPVRIATWAALVLLAVGALGWFAVSYGLGPGGAGRLLWGEDEKRRSRESEGVRVLREQARGRRPLDRAAEIKLRFRRPPRAGLLFELDTGRVLWRHHAQRKLPVASLTKIATAIVTVDRTGPRERLRIPRSAQEVPGSGIGKLRRGKRVRVDALLYALLMVSANDAAVALARHVAGSNRDFMRLMNGQARRLGLTCTRFVSPHGLQGRNRSCAADLAVLARVAMDRRRIARVARKSTASVRFPIKGGRLELNSTNPLLQAGYRGKVGLKTGYTDEAGRCFVGVVKRGKRRLGVVLLDSPDTARQAR